ncbi:MAG: ATP-dependent DNA helicase RecG [Candidatus Harrisonbacteria bacterium]|nr:ATP-dependent DNA helicase RecG [Candidatus Harrisonbacteria bacterium]
MVHLDDRLKDVKGLSPRFLPHLEKLGIHSIRDLLSHFPTRYEDYREQKNISDLIPRESAAIKGRITKVSQKNIYRRRMSIIEAYIEDETGIVRAAWFNQPYVGKLLSEGKEVILKGRVSESKKDLYFSSPLIEDPRLAEKKRPYLLGHYPETRGLTSRGLRYLLDGVIKNIAPIPDPLPSSLLQKISLPDLHSAFTHLHFPRSLKEAEVSRDRLIFDDLLLLQLVNQKTRSRLAKEKAHPIPHTTSELETLLASLPYTLTATQSRSLKEILADIENPHPMNRLLEGDVGSGKTIIALISMLLAARRRFSSFLLAPTEILARQHFDTLQKFFMDLLDEWRINAALITGDETRLFLGKNLVSSPSKRELAHLIEKNEVRLIIGTHTLLEEKWRGKDLALTVIDEQHRFGVRQRAALSGKKSDGIYPHLLSMSATPIPRTLALSIFGDLDLSTIEELPSGRKSVITRIIKKENRLKAYEFIRKEIHLGRQAYIICPRVKKSDDESLAPKDLKDILKYEIKAAEEEFTRLKKEIFQKERLGLLHGKLKNGEKNSIMSAFHSGKIDILVSSSVVEIGVDVKNACVIMIEGADRFGLAQLHQFRGRVGRGQHQSYCLLFTDNESEKSLTRLHSLVESKNGFELAERDLALRGPGELLGDSQTGVPDLVMRSLQNIDLLRLSREAATAIIKSDPDLKNHPLLKSQLSLFESSLHLE